MSGCAGPWSWRGCRPTIGACAADQAARGPRGGARSVAVPRRSRTRNRARPRPVATKRGELVRPPQLQSRRSPGSCSVAVVVTRVPNVLQENRDPRAISDYGPGRERTRLALVYTSFTWSGRTNHDHFCPPTESRCARGQQAECIAGPLAMPGIVTSIEVRSRRRPSPGERT